MEPTCGLSKIVRKDPDQFAREKEGSQFIEYGLIIAVVSATLTIAVQIAHENAGLGSLIGRITTCLITATCT